MIYKGASREYRIVRKTYKENIVKFFIEVRFLKFFWLECLRNPHRTKEDAERVINEFFISDVVFNTKPLKEEIL